MIWIKFEELKALNYTTGGNVLICQCLAIKNEEALKALNIEVEQEYFYTEDEIKYILYVIICQHFNIRKEPIKGSFLL